MAVHIFVRFEAKPGRQEKLASELKLLLEPTRAEPGCMGISLFESIHNPALFFIHSEWKDEAAFNEHAALPHMKRFFGLVDELITHPLRAERTNQVG